MPKSPSKDLFQLVRSLTKAEKRHFKIFVSGSIAEKKNNYVRLFDAIARQKEYDENRILKKEKHIRHLPMLKNRLHEIILQSLNVFHANNSASTTLANYLHRIEILFEKGLYTQCRKIVNKAKHIAYQYEDHLRIFEILTWEQQIMRTTMQVREINMKADKFKKEEQLILKKLSDVSEYGTVVNKMFVLKSQKGKIARTKDNLKKYQALMNHPVFKDVNKRSSYEATRLYYQLNALYFSATENLNKNHQYNKLLVAWIELHPEKMKEEVDGYFKALGNLMISQSRLKKTKECLASIQKMRALSTRSVALQTAIFIQSYTAEINIHARTGDLETCIDLCHEVEKKIQQYESNMNEGSKISIYCNLACLYFCVKNYSRSLLQLNKVLNASFGKTREDLQCIARILNLLIHYEMQNMNLLEHLTRSAHHFLDKRNYFFKVERAIVNFFGKKIPRIITEQENIQAFQELKKELIKITKDPFEKQILEDFDFISWVESKIEKRPFVEILKEKAKD